MKKQKQIQVMNANTFLERIDQRLDRMSIQHEEYRAAAEKDRLDYERRMKKYEETMGAWSNNHGSFAEEYFFNAFEQNRTDFFGEKFDEIEPNLKGIKKGFRDEYDIVLINGKSVGIIEVKYKANKNDVHKTLRKVSPLLNKWATP